MIAIVAIVIINRDQDPDPKMLRIQQNLKIPEINDDHLLD